MPNAISDLIRLYGTDETVEPPRILRAGPLTAEVEAGNLRYIRYRGREMIRAISFIVRDENWGTYAPQISKLNVREEPDLFRVTYDALVRDDAKEFRYAATIIGKSDGSLNFSARGEAISDFLTNRTGFVVLHPIEGVAGAHCTVEHVDGTREETSFPLLIDPVQPMSALRAITHEFLPGVRVTCKMEGDTFEMEDQRNWTDASYKTYVRPLALPWPYLIAKGQTVDQLVSLVVAGDTERIETVDEQPSIAIGRPIPGSAMPPIGLGLHPNDLNAAEQSAEALRQAAPAHLVCHYDPRFGHSQTDLQRMAALGRSIGSELWLEFVIPTVEHFKQDIQEAGRLVDGLPFVVVLVSPAPDLKCTLPGSPWPPCPPLEDCYRAARAAFPHARIGGGMFSFFTELNRKRPPLDLLDLVTFTTVGIFHAGDDRSATEALESLPYMARSVQAFIDGKSYHVGPSAIGLRMNPYGEAPMANPWNIRQAMNGMDPRQRALFGAAWTVGFVSRFAKGGAAAITLGGAVGELGILYTKTPYAQPWFDQNRGVYPVYHSIKGLAAMRDRPLVDLTITNARDIQAIATTHQGGVEMWITNLTSVEKRIAVTPQVDGSVSVLSAPEFEPATQDRAVMDRLEHGFAEPVLRLPPYAIARLQTK